MGGSVAGSYGCTYEAEWTTQIESNPEDAEGHHHILLYGFGSLHIAVKVEVNAYINTDTEVIKDSETKVAEVAQLKTGPKATGTVIRNNSPQNTTVLLAGRLLHHKSMIQLKSNMKQKRVAKHGLEGHPTSLSVSQNIIQADEYSTFSSFVPQPPGKPRAESVHPTSDIDVVFEEAEGDKLTEQLLDAGLRDKDGLLFVGKAKHQSLAQWTPTHQFICTKKFRVATTPYFDLSTLTIPLTACELLTFFPCHIWIPELQNCLSRNQIKGTFRVVFTNYQCDLVIPSRHQTAAGLFSHQDGRACIPLKCEILLDRHCPTNTGSRFHSEFLRTVGAGISRPLDRLYSDQCFAEKFVNEVKDYARSLRDAAKAQAYT
ncbi:hypothetical protein P3342_005920 [Pyrenophora teres f. teres]|nr:hypothetical protein P3342_005920 [Pyrenophora teres f. teres]